MQNRNNFTLIHVIGTASIFFIVAICSRMAAAQTSWQVESIGDGLPAKVTSVLVRHMNGKPQIVAGGTFMRINDQNVNRVAQWNGQAWMPMAAGLGGECSMLKILPSTPDAIYVGGHFEQLIAGPRARCIARWDGNAWSAVGGDIGSCSTYQPGAQWCGSISHVQDVIEFDPDGSGPVEPRLYMSGYFPDGQLYGGTFAWQVGNEWQVYPATNNFYLVTMLPFDDGTGEALYGVGGPITGPFGPPLYRWNGTSWLPIAGASTNGGTVGVGVVHSTGADAAIYIAAPPINSEWNLRIVERWNGTSWQQISETFNGPIDLLASSATTSSTASPLLIAAGSFTQIGSTPVNRLALWNGSEWTQLADVDGTIRSISLDASGPRPLLLIGGDFLTVNGVTVNRIALLKGFSVADLNNDGHVNAADLGVLLGSWGNPGCAGGIPCPADLNNDGQVNAADLGILLGNWG